MKKTLHNRTVLILMIILSVSLVSCGSGGGGGSSHSNAVCIEYDDFNDNTLGAWISSGTDGYAVDVTGGEVHMTAPASIDYSPPSSASITKSISLSGDFVVTIDTVQQSVDTLEWRHQLSLKLDVNNYIGFMDGDATRDWQPGWIVAKNVGGVWTELFFGNTAGKAGIENVPTTMKIKKVGTVYTFSIIRGGTETVVTTQDIPELSSFAEVTFSSWAHYIPVDIIADNFRAWGDPSARSCNP